jgi:hypothetical protein
MANKAAFSFSFKRKLFTIDRKNFPQCRKDLCNEKAELMLVQDLWLRVAANLPATRHFLFNIWWTNKFFIIGGGRFSRFRHGSVERGERADP